MLPNCIVLATDGSEDALLAARAAASISAGTGARLHLVRAWRLAPSRYPSTEMVDRIEAGLRKAMEGEARRLEEMGADVAGSHLRMGPPADAVLDVAEEVGAGLVLVGARGLGPVGRILLGSVSEGVVHHARCPVLVTRGGAWPPEHLVIADDGSEAARSAGDLAAVADCQQAACTDRDQSGIAPEARARAVEARLSDALHGARQGLNDYTGWFAGHAEMAGQYFGYDGPFPPFNDSLVHHYVFTLYALNVQRAPIDGVFTGPQVRQAIYPHVLAEATYSGTYTLNRRLIG